MSDWDENPDNYAKDDNGEFILKVDGTPRKKSGRAKGSKSRGYNYHSKTKAKMAANKTVREKEKKLKAAQNKINGYKQSISNTKETLNKLENKESPTRGKVVEDTVLESLPAQLAAEAKEEVIFRANECS
jgi:hypothetical protein